MISKVRGTEDLLDLTLHNFIKDKIKKHFSLHNYTEIETPILEHTNLFVRSLGKETDVVSKEMYTFETGSGDNICLRPEVTASTMRAFIENGIQTTPWKVFSIGPMFRHERPQKGRWRQFSQINSEIIGTDVISQDAQFLKMLDSFFSEVLDLNNYVLKINFLGTTNDRKMHKDSLNQFLDKVVDKICNTCKQRKEKNTLRIFDCKNKDCQKIYLKAPKLTELLSEESIREWEELKELLDILAVTYTHDPYLVRGLDYYNKTVFEFTSRELGAQSAFCAGGRYDTLATQIGGKQDHPSIGSAMGLGRLVLLLEKHKDKLSLPESPSLSVILPLNQEQQSLALLLAQELRNQDKCVEVLLEGGSMKSMMRKANKLGAKFALIIGEEEQKNGTVSVKNMQTSEDKKIKQSELSDVIN